MVKGNMVKKLIAVILVFCLTATDFIFATTGIVWALSTRTELEDGNLVFEAYFKEGGNKTAQKTANIQDGDVLYVGVDLKAGKLQNGRIKINNANFEIVKEQMNSKYLKNVNAQTKEIELAELNYNDEAIEIQIPIKFQETEKINKDYFEKENSITLSGKYINNETGKEIKTDAISTKLTWTEKNIKLNCNANVEKVIYLENKTIVEAKISSTYADKYYPKDKEKLTLNAPVINNIKPSVVVLADGKKAKDITSTETQDQMIKTVFENNFSENDKIKWNKAGNIYNVIYTYEGLTKIEQPIKVEIETETQLYNNGSLSNKANISADKAQGNIASIDAKSTTGETYKGYLYANSKETTYTETYNLEISSKDTKKVTLELNEDNFKTEQNNNISTNNSTEFKQIKINKEKLVNVIGTSGKIIVNPGNEKLKSIEISNATSADSNGNIVINYNQIGGSNVLTMEVMDIQNEGIIDFDVQKAIIKNAKYDKETLKTINAIETTVKTTSELGEKDTATATTKLKETQTSATLTMNNDNILSTTSENDIEFVATLKTGTMDTDLLKAPSIIITLPEEVTNTKISSISALYAEEALKIAGQNVSEDNKKIVVKLDGEQIDYNNKFVEGIKITVNAKIQLKEMAVSRKTAINMIYTNENNQAKPFETNIDVLVSAPTGLITKSTLDAQFEERNKGVEKLAVVFVNNCGNTIKNLALIGTMPKIEKSKNEFEQSINNNFKSTLEGINTEIQYSEDGDNWNNDYENAKFYKIQTLNTNFEVGEGMGIGIQFETQKILDEFKFEYSMDDAKRKETLKINDLKTNIEEVKDNDDIEETKERDSNNTNSEKVNNEQINEEGTKINDGIEETKENNNTEQNEENEKQNQAPLTIKLVAQTGDGQVKDGDEVLEGQIIRFTYLVKNNTTKEIPNAMFYATHENANVFKDSFTRQEISSKPEEMATYTHELESKDNNVKCNLGTLNAGEAKRITYQIRVKENAEKVENKITVVGDGLEEQNLTTNNFVKNGELKLTIRNNEAKENILSAGQVLSNKCSLTNTTNKDLENVKIEFVIPKEFKYCGTDKYTEEIEYSVIQENDNYVKINVKKIPAGETKSLYVALNVTNEDEVITKRIQFSASVNDNTYYSNEVNVNLDKVRHSQIQASMATNIVGTVKTGDNLIYTISLKNMGNEETNITIEDNVPAAAKIKKIYYIQNNKENIVKDIFENYFSTTIKIAPDEELDVVIETEVNEKLTPDEDVINHAEIRDSYASDFLTTNTVNNKLEGKEVVEESTDIENQQEKKIKIEDYEIEDEGEEAYIEEGTLEEIDDEAQIEQEISTKAKQNSEEKYNISGVVWNDANKNGMKDNIEKAISGIKAELGNIETGEYVEDQEGNKLQSITNEKGEYSFNVPNGKYIVIFTYDYSEYRNSEYRVSSATEENNSDVITSKLSKTNDEIKYAITDTLVLDGNNLENIDAGFIKNEVFDLNLNQYISKVTVQNEEGKKEYELDKSQLTKLEISNKDLENSRVYVEYKLQVKNEGEIAGYANEIVDYLPKDMSFEAKLNKDWYLSNDGYLHNTSLTKEIIEPGEIREISIILTKRLTENNLGLTTNKAEITKTSNDFAVLDKDNGSKNESTSEIIISKDKGAIIIISVIISIIAIITTGVVIYIKKRKE
ncbi:MAG: hypothetical protein IKF38_03915 [Clostridia bacterium]|nr:hypothetical protein [Clostridia bacterium]